jgi:molybdopterin-guanine dinucleotide biosynthesis protein A
VITGIVLAGGRSRRFGADKLAAELHGRSVLAATIVALEPLVDGLVVAGPALPDDLPATAGTSIGLVRDREPFAGPLAALANVLRVATSEAASELAIVVGGDMPRLVPAVLRSMLDRLESDHGVEAVLLGAPPVAAGSHAPRQVLPLALRVGPAAVATRRSIAAGDRSLQSLVDRLAVVELPAAAWLALDPDAQTLADIDTPADLRRVRADGR